MPVVSILSDEQVKRIRDKYPSKKHRKHWKHRTVKQLEKERRIRLEKRAAQRIAAQALRDGIVRAEKYQQERNLKWEQRRRRKEERQEEQSQKQEKLKRIRASRPIKLQLPIRKLVKSFRGRVRVLVLGHRTKDTRPVVLEYLGAKSRQEILEHIEKQFDSNMTWANRGHWHLDHKIPLAYFDEMYDLSKTETQKVAFHYTNLCPMWGSENLAKGSFYEGKRWRYRKQGGEERNGA